MKWLARLGFLAGMLGIIYYDARYLQLETDITAFVPELSEQVELSIVRAMSQAPAGRLVAITIGGADAEARRAAARSLADGLVSDPQFAWAISGTGLTRDSGPGGGGGGETLFEHRFGLMDVPLVDGRIPDAELQRRARAMYRALATPMGSVLRPLLSRDPLFAFGGLLTRLRAGAGNAASEMGGVWETADGERTLVLAVARAAAFSGEAQHTTLEALQERTTALSDRYPGLVFDSTSVGHYAAAAASKIRGDIERISLWSTVGIVLLYLVAFRSLRWPLALMLPIGSGVAAALCAGSLLFGHVHGMALGFGAGLIGVAVDYAAHFFVHRATRPEADGQEVMRSVFPGIALGAATTCVGLGAFVVTPSEGFRQMGLMAIVGVAVAVLATRFALVDLAGPPGRGTSAGLAPLLGLARWLAGRPRLVRVVAAVAVLPALAGLVRARWEDDVRYLQPELPEVEEASARVRRTLGRTGDHDRFLAATGGDDDEALRRAERALERLREALPADQVDRAPGLGALRAPSRQRQVLEALRGDPTLQERLDRALSAAGFSPAAFTRLESLLREAPGPLEPAEVLDSTWGKAWSLMRVPLEEGVTYMLPVGTSIAAQAEAVAEALPEVHYIDPPAVMGRAYERFRRQALWLFGIGVVLVWGVLFVRYRRLAYATACWLSALVSCGAALGAQALFGIPFNPLHLLGVLLVASMAVDYSVYQLETDGGPPALASAALAGITTSLSLGLLATSELPALAAIGLTAALGVLYAFLCATVVASLGARA